MRVISGKYKGRTIECPKGNRIRPTSDMVRSAVYNILNNFVDWENANLLDVFCGTGAFGIEALSRGAKFVGFIDNHRESVEFTKKNLQRIHTENNTYVYSYDATQLPKADRAYDVIFIDPPYNSGLIGKVLNGLKNGGWINAGARIILEESDKENVGAMPGFKVVNDRRYGNTKLYILEQEV